MARTYRRDARGRFASGGYSGQSGGRGARLTATGTRKGGGAKIKTTAPKGTVGKARSTKSAVKSSAKVSRSQRAIATRMKKAVASKNVQATRILQKMAARDGYSGDVKELTAQRILSGNRWTRGKKGNTLSATKSKDLMLNRAPSPALVSAAVSAASAGRVSRRRLDAVLKASGADYMSINRGYDRAVSQARQSLRSRRNRR